MANATFEEFGATLLGMLVPGQKNKVWLAIQWEDSSSGCNCYLGLRQEIGLKNLIQSQFRHGSAKRSILSLRSLVRYSVNV